MSTIKLTKVSIQQHDRGFGGYPFKVVVQISLDSKEFNKLCPKSKHTANRDLGNLVLQVNSLVYAYNNNIPAHSPSIDSNGSKRAKNGVKTLEFVYFFTDVSKAKALGMQFIGNTGCPTWESNYLAINPL